MKLKGKSVSLYYLFHRCLLIVVQYIPLFFIFTAVLIPKVEPPCAIFPYFLEKNYEPTTSSLDSYVRRIVNKEVFSNLLLECNSLVVVHCFYARSPNIVKNASVFHEVASEFHKKIHCFSLDLAEQKEIGQMLLSVFREVASQQRRSNAPSTLCAALSSLITTLSGALTAPSEPVSFYLFFKDGSLLVSSMPLGDDKNALKKMIAYYMSSLGNTRREPLLANDSSSTTPAYPPATAQEKGSVWTRMKSFFKK